MIQALVTTELNIGSTSSLKYSMENLFELCRTGSSVARTHALNILRALFRSTDLGDSIVAYISDGIMCAINCYTAETWGEKNSATLLFSALMVRIFGVQRTRNSENLNSRNKMSCRTFFLRHPQLFDFFHAEIQNSARIILEGGRCLKLQSLLLILSRLYPSALEGVDYSAQLNHFIPHISVCSGSSELKTRIMAAKVIPIFTGTEDILPRIFRTITILGEQADDCSLNFIHGALLQLQYLVKSLPKETPGQNQLELVLKAFIPLDVHRSAILSATYYDVIFEIFTKIASFDDVQLFFCEENDEIGGSVLSRKLVLAKFLRVLQSPSRLMLDVFIQNLNVSALDYEAQETTLNILLLIIDFDGTVAESDDLDINEIEIQLVKRFLEENSANIELFRSYIINNTELFVLVHPLLKIHYYHMVTIKSFALVSYSEKMVQSYVYANAGDYKALVELAETKTSQLRDVIYGCLKRYLVASTRKIDDFSGIINACLPDNSENLR